MHYIHSNQPVIDSAEHVARLIREQLDSGKRVLWLLSGGSGINVDIAAAKLLAGADNLSRLIVSLTDERYGKQGHANENWRELLEAEFVLTGAKLYRPLRATDKLSTLDAYDAWMKKQFTAADYVIGIFGIGSDGHTAGIKPNSDATSAAGYTTYFKGDDYERMTITYQAIAKMDAAIIQASGADKRATLQQLLDKSLPLAAMPAQILHKVPDVSLYTDCELARN